jgi:hypothetical protein
MDKEHTIGSVQEINTVTRGNLYAAYESAVPEGLSSYIESVIQAGNDVYIDMHGNMAIREAYAIPCSSLLVEHPMQADEVIELVKPS